jgi:hypothetical protein
VRPALHQDGPGRVRAIDLDPLTGSDGDRSRVQFQAQLTAEHVQHYSFSVELLSRTSRRNLRIEEARGFTVRSSRDGYGTARLLRDMRWSSGRVAEPFDDDSPERADLAPYQSGIPESAADLIDCLLRPDAGHIRKLIIIKRL